MMKTLALYLRRHGGPRLHRRRADLYEGRRADSPEVVSELPPAGTDGADVADDLSGRPPLGPVDQAARHRTPDAAVGHRSAHRHPELQERSVAARGRDQDHREVGRRRRADGQRRRHAEAARVRRCGSLAHRQAGRDRHLAKHVVPAEAPTGGAATTSRPASPRIATSRRSRASRARPPSSTIC